MHCREVHKKKLVLIACVLGVDVVQTLERAGLTMEWLTDVTPPGEMIDDLIPFDNPLEIYWENIATLFEDGVKGAFSLPLSGLSGCDGFSRFCGLSFL